MTDLLTTYHVRAKQREYVKRIDKGIRLRGWALPLLIFLLAFIPRAISLNSFLTADEDDQLQFSAQFLEAVSRQDWGRALVLGYPGVPTLGLGALGVWLQDQPAYYRAETFLSSVFEAREAPVQANHAPGINYENLIFLPMVAGSAPPPKTAMAAVSESPLDYIGAVRLPLVLIAALVIVVIFLALRRLLDERLALLAALLLAFDPFIMAHSRLIHVDAPLAYFMFAAFVTFIVYLEKGGWPWLLFSGILGALGVLSKTPGIILGPILFAGGLFYVWLAESKLDRRFRLKRLILALLVWVAVAGLAFFALWPSMWSRPGFALNRIVDNLISVMRANSHPSSGTFWGATRSDQNPLYYLLVIPFHLTPLSTIGLLAGLGMIGGGFIHRRRAINSLAARHLPFLLSLLAYDLLFVTPVSFVARRGDRYILPIYFALDVMAAFGLWGLAVAIRKGWLALRGREGVTLRPNYTFGLVSLALTVQVAFIGLYHPYYLTYFNPLFGGFRTAPKLINVGWGEGLDKAAEYLNHKPNASEMTVAAWYSWQFDHFFAGSSVDLASNNPAYSADYTVFYINQIQRGFPSRELLDYFAQRVPEKVVTLGGIDYAWIYPGPIVGDTLPEEMTHLLNVPFRQAVMLAGIDLPGTQISDQIPLTLYWETMQPLPRDFNVSVRVVDQEGTVWGQVDRFPIGGLIRTRSWVPGMVIRDEYMLKLDPGTPPGTYNFDVLMYDYRTGDIFGQATHLGYVEILPSAEIVDVEITKAELPRPMDTQLSPNLNLIGHDLMPPDLRSGQKQVTRLYWHTTGQIKGDRAVSLVARHASGQEITLLTETIGPAGYGTSRWHKGQVLGEAYTYAFPLEALAGEYELLAKSESFAEALLGRITLLDRPRLFALPAGEGAGVEPLSARLGPDIQLSGFQLTGNDTSFDLALYWSADQTPDTDYTVFVHLVDLDGNIVAQRDHIPADGQRPTTTWFPAEFVVDRYHFPRPLGENALWVGMYNPLTGERLPAAGQLNRISENRINLTTLQVSGP